MEEKIGFFKKLKEGLSKTRSNLITSMDYVFNGFTHIDDEFFEEIEEILITGDLGGYTTEKIIDKLKDDIDEHNIKKPIECKEFLKNSIQSQLINKENLYNFENKKSIIVVIGVNGVGKTTSIGKLGSQLKNEGKTVQFCAADTFRSAAIEQLQSWGNKSSIPVIAQQQGSDPASVVYDAIASSKSKNVDILICDTAGRLHNKKNLMNELSKIDKIISREYPDAYRENLIVVDATTGQNAYVQVEEFNQIMKLDGVILTKLDGTAKGGVAIRIESQLKIPIKYVGVGEGIDDLQKFNSHEFIDALFDIDRNNND